MCTPGYHILGMSQTLVKLETQAVGCEETLAPGSAVTDPGDAQLRYHLHLEMYGHFIENTIWQIAESKCIYLLKLESAVFLGKFHRKLHRKICPYRMKF